MRFDEGWLRRAEVIAVGAAVLFVVLLLVLSRLRG